MSLENLNIEEIKHRIANVCRSEQSELNELREHARALGKNSKRLKNYLTNAIAFVAADGGNHKLRIDAGAQFNPAMVELVRIVDSNRNECALDAVAGYPDFSDGNWRKVKPLAKLCDDIEMDLSELSPYLTMPQRAAVVRVYREIVEWAVVYDLAATKEWGSDTMLVHEGPLRSVVFSEEAFRRMDQKFRQAYERQKRENNITLSLVGIAKTSILLSRLATAMALEGVLESDDARYVHVHRALAEKFYEKRWLDTMETVSPGRRYHSMGEMFLVKFGEHRLDPVWPVDVAVWQKDDAAQVLGRLAGDARPGFPIPDFPMSVQKAHDYARIGALEISFLGDILADEIAGLLSDSEKERILRLKYLCEDLTSRRYYDA